MLTHTHTHTQSTCWHLAHPLIFLHSLSHRKCYAKIFSLCPARSATYKCVPLKSQIMCNYLSLRIQLTADANWSQHSRWYKYCHAPPLRRKRQQRGFPDLSLRHLPAYINLRKWKGEFYIFNKPDSALDACVCVCAPIIVISNWPGSIGVARLQLNQNCSKRNWILFPIGRPLK